MRIPCRIIFIQIEQYVIIHRKAVRIRLYRRRHVFPRMDHFHECLILHAVLQQLRKIAARRIVIIIVETGRIHEVGIIHAKFRRLLIHQVNECLFTSADIKRQRPAAVRSTRQQNAIDQVQSRRRIAIPVACPIGTCLNQSRQRRPRNLNRHIFRIRNVLERNNRRHHLGETRRKHPLGTALIQQNTARIQILKIVVFTVYIQRRFRSIC